METRIESNISRKIKKEIERIVFSPDEILQMHGFYFDEDSKSIRFDIIIDFKIKSREELYNHIYDDVKDKFKESNVNITLDIDNCD